MAVSASSLTTTTEVVVTEGNDISLEDTGSRMVDRNNKHRMEAFLGEDPTNTTAVSTTRVEVEEDTLNATTLPTLSLIGQTMVTKKFTSKSKGRIQPILATKKAMQARK
jgi:hypothetical protein